MLYRVDDDEWVLWLNDTTGTTETYNANPGHTYAFRVCAIDHVGNEACQKAAAKTVIVKKYYSAAGQRVAMRSNGIVYYLHTDHLGSTSLTTNETGAMVAEQRYLPYGEVRWVNSSPELSGTLPTDLTYTGQRSENGPGLMDYRARFYSPRLGRFLSADTLVPGVGSLALNRYLYVDANPLKYSDPTGHIGQTEEEEALDIIKDLRNYGVHIGVDFGWQLIPIYHPSPDEVIQGKTWTQGDWSLSDLRLVQMAVHDFANKMVEGTSDDAAQKFCKTVGKVNILRVHGKDWIRKAYEKFDQYPIGLSLAGTVRLYDEIFDQDELEIKATVVHEIVHAWDWHTWGLASAKIGTFTEDEQRPTRYADQNPLGVEWWPETVTKWVYPDYAAVEGRTLGTRHQRFVELMVDGSLSWFD